MASRDLRKLSRTDLLELLLEMGNKNERLTAEVNRLQKELKQRDILIKNAGSIAEAALKLNGVFEAAQAAADQYLENLARLNREAAEEETTEEEIEEETADQENE